MQRSLLALVVLFPALSIAQFAFTTPFDGFNVLALTEQSCAAACSACGSSFIAPGSVANVNSAALLVPLLTAGGVTGTFGSTGSNPGTAYVFGCGTKSTRTTTATTASYAGTAWSSRSAICSCQLPVNCPDATDDHALGCVTDAPTAAPTATPTATPTTSVLSTLSLYVSGDANTECAQTKKNAFQAAVQAVVTPAAGTVTSVTCVAGSAVYTATVAFSTPNHPAGVALLKSSFQTPTAASSLLAGAGLTVTTIPKIDGVSINLSHLPLCYCKNFRNQLTSDHQGQHACTRNEVHGLSGVESVCQWPNRPFIPFVDNGCPGDLSRCIVSYDPPTFPRCTCSEYVNGATDAAGDELCQQTGTNVCSPRNYAGDKKIGNAEFYGCATNMFRCQTAATLAPTAAPTAPSAAPTNAPTGTPTAPSAAPTEAPTNPTAAPTATPTEAPTNPTAAPTATPTNSPTAPTAPTAAPTNAPTAPTAVPTDQTDFPTASPTNAPVTG